jgi:hypothetical protein
MPTFSLIVPDQRNSPQISPVSLRSSSDLHFQQRRHTRRHLSGTVPHPASAAARAESLLIAEMAAEKIEAS